MTSPPKDPCHEARLGTPILLVGRGDEVLALQECLREQGWDSVRAEEPAECRATIAALGVELAVVFLVPGEDGSRWAGLASEGFALSIVLALDASPEEIERAMANSNASDYLELPLRPALAMRRLGAVVRAHACTQGSERVHRDADQRPATLSASLPGESPGDARVDLIEGRPRFALALDGDLSEEEFARDQAAVLILKAIPSHDGVGEQQPAFWKARLESLAEILGMVTAELDESLSEVHRVRAARLQPESFAIFTLGEYDERDIESRASELYESLISHWADDSRGGAVSIHIGLSFEAVKNADASRLIEHAETACYCARQRGRRKVQIYSDYMSLWASERRSLTEGLRMALEEEQLIVHYQPRIDARTREVRGMEALVRWQHPDLGMIPPGKFIHLAEETGIIEPMGEWVLREACRQNREWQDRGFEPIRVSVNLSAVQFHQSELFETVERALRDTGLEARWLELELTESMLMNDPRSTIATLRRFKDAGIHLSIDDFGTGYSSLSYLKRFPIDALKIDRSFVREITTNPDDAAIATAIILMGHSLKLDVVAEGVETESQLSFLQILQCNEVQGFLISRPVPPEKAEYFLVHAGQAQAI